MWQSVPGALPVVQEGSLVFTRKYGAASMKVLWPVLACLCAHGAALMPLAAADMPPDVIVIPTPRAIAPVTGVGWVSATSVDLLVADAPETVHVAAEDLGRDLTALAGASARVRTVDKLDAATSGVVLVLGVNLSVPGQAIPAPPDRPEGYVIQPVRQDERWVIHLNGRDERGTLWATKTVKQLARNTGAGLELFPCRVEDWPWYPLRCSAIDFNVEDLLWTALDYKINTPYFAWIHLQTHWRDPPDWYRKSITSIAGKLSRRGLDMLQKLHPYWVANNDPPHKDSIRATSDEDIEKLMDTFRLSIDAGSRIIALTYDDASRLVPPEDLERFGSVAAVHAHVFHRFVEKLKAEHPGVGLVFLPEPYSGAPKAYLSAFTDMPDDTILLWVGPSGNAVSHRYPDGDLATYRDAIGNRPFMIHDNIPYQRHGLVRGWCLFDSYADGYGNLYRHCVGMQPSYTYRPKPLINLAHGMVIAEYMWNADRYDAEEAVARAMAKVGGRAAVPHLQAFKQAYVELARRYPVEKVAKGLTEKLLMRYAASPDQLKKDLKTLGAAKQALAEVAASCPNGELVEELNARYNDLATLLGRLSEFRRPVPLYTPRATVKLSFDDFAGGTGYKKYGYHCEPRYAVWAYGLGTTYHEITTAFRLSESPAGPAALVLDAQGHTPEVLIEVLVNGEQIYRGACGFVAEGWGVKRFPVPADVLREGRNELKFRNVTSSMATAADWIMFSSVALEFGP